jgi:hypothetical protein
VKRFRTFSSFLKWHALFYLNNYSVESEPLCCSRSWQSAIQKPQEKQQTDTRDAGLVFGDSPACVQRKRAVVHTRF